MGSRIECFWMVPTERGRQELRRYERQSTHHESCPANPMRIHDASVQIEDVDYPTDPQGLLGYGRDDFAHDDPRWPAKCPTCGYAFAEGDYWQHNVSRYFSGAPDGKLYTTRNMPPGAMYDATWWGNKGTDGIALAVVLPPGGDVGGTWHPDSPSVSGGAWHRSGTIPRVTCTPSILTPHYHGFLTDGWLVEC